MPGVQVHDDGGGVADQAAGSDFQQLGVPLELQGEGLQGDQAEFSAQRSPSRPQSRGRVRRLSPEGGQIQKCPFKAKTETFFINSFLYRAYYVKSYNKLDQKAQNLDITSFTMGFGPK